MFLGLIALKNAGIVVDHPATLVGLGDLTQTGTLLAIAGFFIITGCVLVVCSIPGPWIVAGVFLWLKRSEGQTITEMADQLRGDIAGHGAAGRKGGAE